MKKYDVTLTAHYEKTVAVYAATPAQAREKIEIILVEFSDDDLICGEATINDSCEDGCEETDESLTDDCCSECAYFCTVCGNCLYEDES